MKRSLLVLAASLVSIPALVASPHTPILKNLPMPSRTSIENEWNADFDAAAKLAKEQKKDLLVDFTGSGWCGWCTKLHDEVFVKEEFLKAAQEKYVLVALDFESTGKPKKTQPMPQVAEELKVRCKVQGFPTIALLTPDGQMFAKTGYKPGGAGQYVTHLAEIHESGRKRLDELLAFDAGVRKAKGEELVAGIDAAIEQLKNEPPDSPFVGQIARTVKIAFAKDANAKSEQQMAAAKALIERGVIDAELGAAVATLDPKNEQSLREQYVLAVCNSIGGEGELPGALTAIADLDAAGPIHDKTVAEQIYANAAWWNHKFLQKPDEAKKYAQKVKDLGTSNPRLAAVLDQILNS